ncbi:MAG: Tim44 domain-containing protein [Sulfurihydrogenibium sp.]|uniref:Tim44 domain-containing protein n=1 Tax=Sulfurihydrogenibium sp. TaxID=2053621 RepID=UPI003D145F4F
MKKFIVMLITLAVIFLVNDSFARAGKGFSSGFRSYKSQDFNRVNKNPSQPSPYQQQKQVQNQPGYQPQTKPSFFSSPIFKWLVGGLIFGALISLLLGHGLHFGMPGLLEILLIIGVIYFILRMLAKKKEEQPAYATNANTVSEPMYAADTMSVGPYINEELILNLAKNAFVDIQRAWSEGNLDSVKNFLTDRMYVYLNSQLQDLKAKGLRNIVEDVKILDAQVVHVEEEGDNKVVIVEIEAEAKDYTVDRYGNVVEGDKNNPVRFKEYWAFVGKALNWKLDDIRQVEDV